MTLPLSSLDDNRIIDEVIDELISGLDPVEAISYSSFLNMVAQTCEPEESARLGRREIAAVGFRNKIPDNKVFFHRDCLLHMISRIIAGAKDGTMRITGGSDRRGTAKYYKAILLINSEINKTNRINSTADNKRYTLLKDYCIRDFPPPYSPKTTSTIFKNRLQRYWYIYDQILPQIKPHEAELIKKSIDVLEKDSGLTLREHYSVLAGVLNWFLLLPVEKRKRDKKIPLGFDYRNIDSFYIRKNNFDESDQILRLIGFLAKEKNSLQKQFDGNRRDQVTGFYKHFRDFFDRPVFKIDGVSYCILDLKFLIENLCSGFLWRIESQTSLQNIHQGLKGYYGNLLEKYFVFLLNRIFNKNFKSSDSGPDYIVEAKDCLLIFEFTTEYFRFASLYNTSIAPAKDDLHRLLFNQGKNDLLSRGKKEKGKFLKLNEYLNSMGQQGKTIIPILITENYLGDYDLLNHFDNFLDKKIQKYGLTNIQKNKPLILCLDDLEIFWALSNEDNVVQDLETRFQTWEKSDKGKFLYNFSYFILSPSEAIKKNKGYIDFFNYSKFLDELEK